MDNVVAFPQSGQADKAVLNTVPTGTKTLFMYVKRASLIVHLSGRDEAVAATNVAQKRP